VLFNSAVYRALDDLLPPDEELDYDFMNHTLTKPDTDRYVLALGTIEPRKYHVGLLAAFEAVLARTTKARIDHKEGETKLIAIEVSSFEATPERREVLLRIDALRAKAGLIRELAALVKEYPGEAPVVVALETSAGPKTLQLGNDYRVQPVPDFFAEAKALLGEAAVV